jgi:hypothetical protein
MLIQQDILQNVMVPATKIIKEDMYISYIISFIPFHRPVQDYKIHMDMEMVIFLQVMLYNHKGI